MITLNQVSVSLGKADVLRGVNASFARGRVTAILGPNGAGKTTLLRATLGLVPHTGAISLAGTPLNAIPARERAQRMGYLPQLNVPSWNLRVADLIMLGRTPHRMHHTAASPDDHAAVFAAMAATDTTQFAARLVNELSGGERARVLLARVLATQPDWLLIDEPLNHLDPKHQREMLRLLQAQAAHGSGVIVVLHDLNAAAKIADNALLLRHGALITQGPASAVFTPENLAQAYDMPFTVSKNEQGRLMITAKDD